MFVHLSPNFAYLRDKRGNVGACVRDDLDLGGLVRSAVVSGFIELHRLIIRRPVVRTNATHEALMALCYVFVPNSVSDVMTTAFGAA